MITSNATYGNLSNDIYYSNIIDILGFDGMVAVNNLENFTIEENFSRAFQRSKICHNY